MNTPNPLTPQGSLHEQSKRKSQVRLIVFSILAIHVVLLGALLIQGCKREEPPPFPPEPTNLGSPTPFIESNLPPLPPPPLPTNIAPPPLPESNVVVPPPVLPPPEKIDTPPPVVPPAPASEHVIQKGDTFSGLAAKYGVSVKAIMQANPGVDPTKLQINQKIVIPPKPPPGLNALNAPASTRSQPDLAPGEKLYEVKKGDNLTKIANAHGTTVKAIRAANNLRTDQIRIGQKLKIPSKSPSSSSRSVPVAPSSGSPLFPSTPSPVESPSSP